MRILVLCTGNSCRSQMAEGFFRAYAQQLDLDLQVASAGLKPKGVHPLAIKAMAERGVDISKHASDPIERYLDDKFDFVITVCDNAAANCPVFPGAGTKLHWPFDDPDAATGSEAEVMDEFRRVRDQIAEKVSSWLEGIRA